MKLIWTINIDDESYLSFNHNCTPFLLGKTLYYAFLTLDKTKINEENLYENKIVILEIDIHSKKINTKEILVTKYYERILNTKNWQIIIEEDYITLLVGIKLIISKSTITISDKNIKLEEFNVKSKFNFINNYITYNHRSTIECFSQNTKKLLWKQNIKGYLYTDITVKANLIFFGTAGNGGAFYTINIDTGHILVEFNNGDASEFSWIDNNVIIKDKKGNLVKLNTETGEINNILILKEKIHFCCPILVHGNKIFTRVYNNKQKIAKLIYVEDLK